MIRVVVVGVDGSPASTRAAEFARDLVKQTGARLVAVIAFEPPEMASLGLFDAFSVRAAHPEPEQLREADRVIHALGLPPEQLVERLEVGPPGEVLPRIADEVAADLIVVGARGLGRAEAALLGSVSARLVRESRCPVTVVH